MKKTCVYMHKDMFSVCIYILVTTVVFSATVSLRNGVMKQFSST